jgi:hypothetical protein
MSAAVVVGSEDEPSLDRAEVARQLSQLHIILLSLKADTEDVLSPVRPPNSGADLKRGISRALACLDALRERIREG